MSDGNDLSLKTKECISSLTTMENNLSIFLGELGLPNENILVPMSERGHFFRSAPYHLEKLEASKKSKSVYISKFFAAVSAGLFDAALNYLWNETINDLRSKIEKFNLDFFISTIEISDRQREKLNKSKNLVDLQDYDLIKGARKITLISEIGFKELEHINYMRNWASAAHYNNTDLTATKLLYYFEICLKEVISLPTPVIIADMNKLFIDIKDRKLDKTNILTTVKSFENLSEPEIENLINGLFGLYTNEDSSSFITENINIFLSSFVDKTSNNIKEEIGMRYASFKINNMETREHKARDFLKLIKGEGFIPDNIRVTEINVALDELHSAHYSNGNTNFHTEPILASQLEKIVGDYGKTPKSIEKKYVNTIIDVFLTNGLGNAWNADPYYKRLIKNFNTNQVNIAITSFINESISSKLEYSLCKKRYIEMLDMIEVKVIDDDVKKFILKLKKYKEALHTLKGNSDFLKDIKNLKLL